MASKFITLSRAWKLYAPHVPEMPKWTGMTLVGFSWRFRLIEAYISLKHDLLVFSWLNWKCFVARFEVWWLEMGRMMLWLFVVGKCENFRVCARICAIPWKWTGFLLDRYFYAVAWRELVNSWTANKSHRGCMRWIWFPRVPDYKHKTYLSLRILDWDSWMLAAKSPQNDDDADLRQSSIIKSKCPQYQCYPSVKWNWILIWFLGWCPAPSKASRDIFTSPWLVFFLVHEQKTVRDSLPPRIFHAVTNLPRFVTSSSFRSRTADEESG